MRLQIKSPLLKLQHRQNLKVKMSHCSKDKHAKGQRYTKPMLYRRYSRSSPDSGAALAAPVTMPYLNRSQRHRLTQDLVFQARTGLGSPGGEQHDAQRPSDYSRPPLSPGSPPRGRRPRDVGSRRPNGPRRPQRVHARTAPSPAGRKKRAATARVLASLLPRPASYKRFTNRSLQQKRKEGNKSRRRTPQNRSQKEMNGTQGTASVLHAILKPSPCLHAPTARR
ncbi:uncharacterized protein LOC128076574 [Tympanuchus pallidicinctus]|uniref:uncharacterized protein LOC128076574 n=1 Tax=Tympanuchus pallidicinctus TaxID=109042 RepID=UPI0022874322|nr:uncharacterized protein LOC128076574 [Tympanuchus pallidicinctus]